MQSLRDAQPTKQVTAKAKVIKPKKDKVVKPKAKKVTGGAGATGDEAEDPGQAAEDTKVEAAGQLLAAWTEKDWPRGMGFLYRMRCCI